MRAWRPQLFLFGICFVAYAYFYQAGGWNQNSRFDLTRALVEERSNIIDSYHRNTGDKSCRGPDGRCVRASFDKGEHYYCDKAPGASWLAVIPYAVYRGAADELEPEALARAAWWSTIWSVSLPAALCVVFLFSLLARFGMSERTAAAWSLAYGLGTLAFPYATLFYGHQLTAAMILIGFSMLVVARLDGAVPPWWRLVVAGLVLGLAVAVEYPAALAVAPIGVYTLIWLRPRTRILWLGLGLAIPGLAVAAYHTAAFGGPFTLPYEFSTQPHRSQGFFMGLGAPSAEALWGISFSSFRGLFFSSPWLLLAVPGAWVIYKNVRYRGEMWVCFASVLLYFWLNGSLVDWQGGWAMGPRYLIPAIPFLAILAAGSSLGAPFRKAWLRWGKRAAVTLAVSYSTFLMLVGTAVKPEVPSHIGKPFAQYLFPHFFRGQLAVSTQSIDSISAPRGGAREAWNIGMELFGLDGFTALIPILILIFGLAFGLLWASRLKNSAAPIETSSRE